MITTYRPGTVYGAPNQSPAPQPKPPAKPTPPKEASLDRAVNYFADYSGCGHWRMLWPEQVLSSYQHMIVHGSTCMIRDPAFYGNIKSIRLQRQANPAQLNFFKEMRKLADKNNFRLIYEIDDIVLHEDIPDYNKYKFAFESEEIRSCIIEMMQMSDEISCTCDYMKDYFVDKTGNKNVTVIPNYPPRFWLDGHFDENIIMKNYDRHVKKRKKPRVLYAGSGAHFDVDNKVNQQDDFAHVRETIMKTCNKIQWVFVGAYPPVLHSLVQQGKIEFHPWQPLYDLPRFINNLKVNCMVAPLIDNTFNRCKSDIKFTEACAHGIPVVCQDMITYQSAHHKFSTGDEMIDQINTLLKDKQQYMKHCRKANQYVQNKWLELPDNIGKYKELYTTPYGCDSRKLINKINDL